jgi:hypothetical protein
MKAKTVKQALIAMRYILNRYGWCQGNYYVDKQGNSIISPYQGPLGGCCLSGARDLVECDDYDTWCQIRYQINSRIWNVIGIMYATIPAWNDHPNRTKQEVLDLLDKLIEEA